MNAVAVDTGALMQPERVVIEARVFEMYWREMIAKELGEAKRIFMSNASNWTGAYAYDRAQYQTGLNVFDGAIRTARGGTV